MTREEETLHLTLTLCIAEVVLDLAIQKFGTSKRIDRLEDAVDQVKGYYGLKE